MPALVTAPGPLGCRVSAPRRPASWRTGPQPVCVVSADAASRFAPRNLRLGIPSKGRMAELTLELLNVRARNRVTFAPAEAVGSRL